MQDSPREKPAPLPEIDTDVAMGLFPLKKYSVPSERVARIAVMELLQTLSSISNSEGPLRKKLPIPFIMNEDKQENQVSMDECAQMDCNNDN